MGERHTDEDLAKMASPPVTAALAAPRPQNNPQTMLANSQASSKRAKFLIQEGAAVIVDSSSRGSGGTRFVSGATVAQPVPEKIEDLFGERRLSPYQKESESKMVPQMTMAIEDYNRIIRMIRQGVKPKMTVDIKGQYYDEQFGEMKGGGGNRFGPPDPNAPKPGLIKGANYNKLSAYYNLDNGTGKICGVYMQGNAAVKPYFEAWLAPFADMGAKTLTISNTGGTDHLAYDAVGLSGFQFIQNEIEYDTRTHDSNQDNYDRIQADDMKQAATIMAAFVYQTAMMDEKMPRKPAR